MGRQHSTEIGEIVDENRLNWMPKILHYQEIAVPLHYHSKGAEMQVLIEKLLPLNLKFAHINSFNF